jgi:predicted nucleic acid-binding protein
LYNCTNLGGVYLANQIVVDASVLIAVVINEPEKAKLLQLTQNSDLIAPSSVHWEIGNAFSAMFKRNRITVAMATKAINAYEKIPIRIVDIELDESVKLANKLNIYAYDAYMIRCSIKYKAPLLSLDKSLINSAISVNAQVIRV